MAKSKVSMEDAYFLSAALEGLELQKQRIDEKIAQVKSLLNRSGGRPAELDVEKLVGRSTSRRKRQLSPAARKRISQAQKRRWADYRKNKQDSAA